MSLKICTLFCILSMLHSVLCDSITWGMRDLTTKSSLCCNGRCDLKYGEVVLVEVTWKFDGADWVQPQVYFVDYQFAFLNSAKGSEQMYYVCPHGNKYRTSLLPCNFVAKAGTFNFVFTITALTSTEDEFISKTQIHMNKDNPRAISAPVNVVHVNK